MMFICQYLDICMIKNGELKKMGSYITVTWVTETPVSQGMSYGNTCLLCSGNAPEGANNPQIVTSSSYLSVISSSSYEYKALASYFKNFTGSPTNTTYCYWMGSSANVSGDAIGSRLTWQIKYPPYESIDSVWIDPTGGSNWQEVDAFDISTTPSGFIAITGDNGLYNGFVNFSGVYVNDVDQGGPYFESGGANYSGEIGRDIIDASGGRLQIRAARSPFGVAAANIIPLDVQFIAAPYDIATDNSGIMGDSGAIDDLRSMLSICAGNRMMAVWALPKGGSPGSNYDDAGVNYELVRDYVGQDKNAIVFYADVTTGSDGSGLDDPAAALLGKICSTAPHTTLTLADVNLGLVSRTNENDENAWTAGQVSCIIRKSDLGFTTDQLSYGFTFSGTSPSNRLNNVRCKYIVEYNVLVDLWMLLSSRNARISKNGLSKIIDTINGTLNRMEAEDIIDPGSRMVEIPLMGGTPAEWSQAKLTRRVPAIRVRWTWNTAIEQLNITQFGEIL